LVAGAARQERQNRVSGAINEEPPIPRGLVLNSGGRTRTDDPRIMNLGPSGWRRGQEVFDGERIGGALTRATAVRCRPEADALQTGMLRRLSGERLTVLKPMGRVSEVIRFGNVIDLRRTERRQSGVRIIQNALEELIVCGACRIDVAVEIDATGRYRQAVIDHEFQAPIHEEHGTMPIQDGETGIDIRIVEHNGRCATIAAVEINRRPDTRLRRTGHKMRVVGREEPPRVSNRAGWCHRIRASCFGDQEDRFHYFDPVWSSDGTYRS